MRKFAWVLLGLCLSAAGANNVTAELITAAPSSGESVIDFSQFDQGSFHFDGTPLQVGNGIGEDVVFSSNSSGGGVGPLIGSSPYFLAARGTWAGREGFIGTNSPNADVYLRFDFAEKVSSVGGFINYSVYSLTPPYDPYIDPIGTTIIALDGNGTVLESYFVDDFTSTGTNDGAFRGISTGTNNIAAFLVRGNYGVIDDLTFARVSSVPEPSSLLLFGLGGLGAGWVARRRQKKSDHAAE